MLYLHNKDVEKQIIFGQKVLEVPSYRNKKISLEIKELIRSYKITNIEQIKKSIKKAAAYESFAQQYPKDRDVQKIWYSSAKEYLKAGEVNKSLSILKMIIKNYKKRFHKNFILS